MNKSAFLCVGALLCGFNALATAPVWAQPLPVERAIPKINNLSLKEIAPDEAEKLAMPAQGIALHLQDATLSQALDELQRQSGVKLDLGWTDEGTLAKKLSLDLETRYFMPAFTAIMDEAGVKASLQRFGREEAYKVRFGQDDGDNVAPLLSGVGPFQLRLENVGSNFNQTVSVSADKKPTRSQNRSYSIAFNSKVDPVVDVTGTPMIILKRVDDDKGRSLLDTSRHQWMRYNFDGGWSSTDSQEIQTPAPDAKMLSRVEGTVVYVVPSARQRWEIADITGKKDVTHEFASGGRTVRVLVKSANREDGIIDLSLEMSAPPLNNGGESDPLFSFGQMAKAFTLQDANGNVFRSRGYGGESNGEKITMRGQFALSAPRGPRAENGERPAPPAIAEPIKLVFDSPTDWAQTAVPFSFSDVPLP